MVHLIERFSNYQMLYRMLNVSKRHKNKQEGKKKKKRTVKVTQLRRLLCVPASSRWAGTVTVTDKTGKHNRAMQGHICQSGLCCHTISSRTVGRPKIQVALMRDANLVCGSKWSWPVWLRRRARPAIVLPDIRQMGEKCGQVLRWTVPDGVIMSEYQDLYSFKMKKAEKCYKLIKWYLKKINMNIILL